MKKLLIAFLCLLVGAFCACGGEANVTDESQCSESTATIVSCEEDEGGTSKEDASADATAAGGDKQSASKSSDSSSSTKSGGGSETTTKSTETTQSVSRVSYTIDNGKGQVFYSGTLDFTGSASVYDLLRRTGVSYQGSGSYIKSLAGMTEKEYGPMSGWMYSVNGSVPMTACGGYKLKDGDVVRWYYYYGE